MNKKIKTQNYDKNCNKANCNLVGVFWDCFVNINRISPWRICRDTYKILPKWQGKARNIRKMDYKNSKKVPKNEIDPKEQNTECAVRKSRMNAADEYDYRKLCRQYPSLLDCTLKETREELKFTYDTHEVEEWEKLRGERREMKLAALLDVARLKQTAQQYRISLVPENLYYDIHGRVAVRERDVYGAEQKFDEAEFVKQYQALIGCTLTTKYKFEDYYDGGMDLLKEEALLGEIAACEHTEEIAGKLREEYVRYQKLHREKYTEVGKSRYRGQKRALILVGLIALLALLACGYLGVWERPYQQAVIAEHEAYLRSDYEAVVDAMQRVDISRMNVSQKYILATACVKCESFSAENQKNILNTISLTGDTKVMEYWIHINRLETTEAADIAMQISSDQLLYYAYLKEKTVVENDSTLTGEEKSARLSELESKLEPLKEEYSSMTEE